MANAKLTDCVFINTDLTNACLEDATLVWSEEPPKTHYEYIEENGEPPQRLQKSYSPFDGADLCRTSFEGAVVKNGDFRGALNIASANFKRVKGLDTCIFDIDALENKVLGDANVRTE